MANKSDLESYIMRCARKYEEKHPEAKVRATKKVELSIKECEFCTTNKPLVDIPFSLATFITKKQLFTQWDNEMIGIDINYCPMCGKEL